MLSPAGAQALDLAIPESKELKNRHPFKGNIDLGRLERLLEEAKPGQSSSLS